MKYGYKKQIVAPFEEAVEKTELALAHEGFGILTKIDVQATLKQKLEVHYDKYVILGACNPPFAHKALMEEKEIGLLLPCNVIVFEDQGKVFVSAILPTVAMAMVENEKLQSIAKEIEDKLKKSINSLE